MSELARPRQDDDADDEGHEADAELRALQEAAPRDAVARTPAHAENRMMGRN